MLVRTGIVALLLFTFTSTALLPATTGEPGSDTDPNDQALRGSCPHIQWRDGVGDSCLRDDGLLEVFAPDGRSLGFTHGPDPVPDADVVPVMNPREPACAEDPIDGYFGLFIYARAHDDTDRFAEMEPQLRDAFRDINGHLYDNAIDFGRERDFIMHCTGGQFTLLNEVLPTDMGDASFSTIVDDLNALGYDNHRTKYWVWYDDQGACSCGGTGHVYGDERLIENNRNNGVSSSIPMFGVTFGYLGIRVMMHENGHNLGAVQNGSPNASGGWHCNDGQDIMCYADGGSTSDYDPNVCSTEYFDCNHDDYFHPDPPPGNWLETHWNLGSDLIRYHAFNHPPEVDTLTCSPEPTEEGEPTTCSFRADDDSSGVYYVVDWGDGTGTTRVPSSGFVAPGGTRNADHSYASEGTYVVRVTATDNEAVGPRTSAERSWTQQVAPPNVQPTMQSVTCTPNPSDSGDAVTCTFRATDDSTGVYYTLSWGDGSGTTRVPASGFVSPGSTETVQHVYNQEGSFTVSATATDNDALPLTSAALTHLQSVSDPNTAPTMTSLGCSPNPAGIEETVTCEFVASDDSGGVHYTIDWGDGSASERAPTTGHALPGAVVSRQHTWSTSGAYTVAISATDNDPTPLTGAALQVTQSIDLNNQVPVMDDLVCTPATSDTGQTVTCDFHADDDSMGVYYHVDWGDGTATVRVPSMGTVTPGTTQQASHAFASAGTVTISVQATDDESPPASSTARILQHTTVDPNQAPAMTAITCGPDGAEAGQQVQCSFTATDDSTGVRYTIDWGDGSPAENTPVSGHASPGATIVKHHAYSTPGTYTVAVEATDNDPSPLTSAVLSTTQTVEPANDAPLMHTLNCNPTTAGPGDPVTCTLRANDDSAGITYTVDWGDGTAPETVPPSGSATPGIETEAAHTFSDTGSHVVSASATDDQGLTSGTLTLQIEISPPNAVPIMDLLSCSPEPTEAGESGSCQLRAADDSGGVHFTVDWGDGSPLQRVPDTGYVAPGATMARAHTWSSAGTYTVRATATDNAGAPLTSIELSVDHETVPPCAFDRTGSLTVGLAGEEIDGMSAKWEPGVPVACEGHTFTLTGSAASDFNVCWYDGAIELQCNDATGTDSGLIPAGTTRARIIYYSGSGGDYHIVAS